MRIKEFLLSKAFRIIGFEKNVTDYIYAFNSIGYPSGAPIPKVLMNFNILNVIRGVFGRFVISTNLDWIWPFWAEKQFYAKYNDFSARGFQPASINTTNRNWTGVGTLDSEWESIIDPRGLVTPYNNSWSLDTWLQIDGKVYSPAKLPEIKQTLKNNLPIVETEFTTKNKIKCTSTVFVTEIPDISSITFQKTELKNISSRPVHFTFAFAFRPYNPEGIALIQNLSFREDGSVLVNKELAGLLMQLPNGVTTSSLSKGDVHYFIDEAWSKLTDCHSSRVGMATGVAAYRLNLNPGESRTFEIRMPNNLKLIQKTKKAKFLEHYIHTLRHGDYKEIFEREQKNWLSKLKQGMTINIPDKKINDCFDANKAYMLMFYDNTYITPGPSTYHDFWFRDATYLLNGLDKLGFHHETANVLRTYKTRIYANGFFYSQDGEWDSNGQAIWTLVEHYRLTRDKEFLKENLNIISRGARWIGYKIRTNLKQDPGYKGLLPSGLSAEHFGLNDYYYWDDFWGMAGLKDAVYTAQELQKDGTGFAKDLLQLQDSVETSLQYASARLGLPIMPISPSRRMDSAAIGCLAAYYPCRIISPNDQRLQNTITYLEKKCFIGGGFFHDVNHSGFGTYLTMHIAQCHIGTRSNKALDILEWILSVASSTWCWPEAIHPRTMGGTIGDGHHGWAAADFTILIRNMLILEETDTLNITPMIPAEWITPGKEISLSNAPTYFGSVSYKITTVGKIVTLKLDNSFERGPKQIVWRLPKTIVKVIGGKNLKHIGDEVTFSPKVKEIKVQVK